MKQVLQVSAETCADLWFTIFKCLFIRPLIGQSCAQSQLAFRYFCCCPMYLTVQVVQDNNSQAETMSTVTPEHN